MQSDDEKYVDRRQVCHSSDQRYEKIEPIQKELRNYSQTQFSTLSKVHFLELNSQKERPKN